MDSGHLAISNGLGVHGERQQKPAQRPPALVATRPLVLWESARQILHGLRIQSLEQRQFERGTKLS